MLAVLLTGGACLTVLLDCCACLLSLLASSDSGALPISVLCLLEGNKTSSNRFPRHKILDKDPTYKAPSKAYSTQLQHTRQSPDYSVLDKGPNKN